jgi:hypothetical protein
MELQILSQKRDCNGCGWCCKVFDITRDDGTVKPRNQWCENISIGSGGCSCSTYDNRWKPCRDFVCLWAGGAMPEEFAPPKVKAVVITTTDGRGVVIHEDPNFPGAWRKGKFHDAMVDVANSGIPVFVVSGDKRSKLGADPSAHDIPYFMHGHPVELD